MAYEAHITKAEFWADDDEPITFEEIEVLDLPAGFTAEGNHTVTANTPFGVMSTELGRCIVFTKPDGTSIYLVFSSGVPTFGIRSADDTKEFIRLAEMLGAKVQGDEGEIYG